MLQHNQLQKVHLCPSSHRSLTNCFSWFALCAVRIKCLMNMVKNLVFSLIDCGCSPIFRKCSQVFNRYSIRCCINSCFSPCRKKVLLLTLIPIKLGTTLVIMDAQTFQTGNVAVILVTGCTQHLLK